MPPQAGGGIFARSAGRAYRRRDRTSLRTEREEPNADRRGPLGDRRCPAVTVKSTLAVGAITDDQGITTDVAGTSSSKFITGYPTFSMSFSPSTIVAGATSQLTVTIANLRTSALTSVGFSDTLPANMTLDSVPAGAGCQQTGQSAPTDVISGTTITFANISLLTVITTQTDCNVTFDVTSYSLGNATSRIAAGGVISTSGATNAQAAAASLTVVAGVALQKTFVASSFAIGDVDYVRFIIVNSGAGALSSGTLTDNMPAALALANLTAHPSAQSGDPVSCGGTVSGTIGSSTFSLSGMNVTGATGSSTPRECVRYVQVMASSTGGPGSVTNSVPAAGLTIGALPNQTAANGGRTAECGAQRHAFGSVHTRVHRVARRRATADHRRQFRHAGSAAYRDDAGGHVTCRRDGRDDAERFDHLRQRHDCCGSGCRRGHALRRQPRREHVVHGHRGRDEPDGEHVCQRDRGRRADDHARSGEPCRNRQSGGDCHAGALTQSVGNAGTDARAVSDDDDVGLGNRHHLFRGLFQHRRRSADPQRHHDPDSEFDLFYTWISVDTIAAGGAHGSDQLR
jgi:uncharacterized repeat protein (TIGR01451 family)